MNSQIIYFCWGDNAARDEPIFSSSAHTRGLTQGRCRVEAPQIPSSLGDELRQLTETCTIMSSGISSIKLFKGLKIP